MNARILGLLVLILVIALTTSAWTATLTLVQSSSTPPVLTGVSDGSPMWLTDYISDNSAYGDLIDVDVGITADTTTTIDIDGIGGVIVTTTTIRGSAIDGATKSPASDHLLGDRISKSMTVRGPTNSNCIDTDYSDSNVNDTAGNSSPGAKALTA